MKVKKKVSEVKRRVRGEGGMPVRKGRECNLDCLFIEMALLFWSDSSTHSTSGESRKRKPDWLNWAASCQLNHLYINMQSSFHHLFLSELDSESASLTEFEW